MAHAIHAPQGVDSQSQNHGLKHVGPVASAIFRAAFAARTNWLRAERDRAAASGDLSAAERWHERLVEHETTDWLAEVAR